MKRYYIGLLLLPFMVIGCSSTTKPEEPPVISSVTLEAMPDKTTYTVGEYFAPKGLAVTVYKSDKSSSLVYWEESNDDFSFSPSLTTALTTNIKSVTATYSGFDVSIPITVEEGVTNTVTIDFTVKHTKDDSNIPTQGNTNNNNLADIINHYYLEAEDLSITSVTGGYMQIQNGWDITTSRSVDQLLLLGSRTLDCQTTFTFSKAIKKVTLVSEAYSKYVSYDSTYHNDHDSYAIIDYQRWDYPSHAKGDTNETKNASFTINKDSFKIETPAPNPNDPDSMARRVMVYQMTIEY